MAGNSIAQGGRVIGRGFKYAYELAGTTMVLSVLWFIFAFMPTYMMLLVAVDLPAINTVLFAVTALLFFFGPITATVYSVAYAAIHRETSGIFREVLSRLKLHYSDSVKVTAGMFTILVILIVDLVFFLRSESTWIQYMSVFWMYLILFWALMFQYVYPVMVREERKGRDVRVLNVLKMSALLALDNLIASFIILLAGAAFTWISMFLSVPILLFLAGTLGFLHVTALETLIQKYARAREDSDENPEKEPDQSADDDKKDSAGVSADHTESSVDDQSEVSSDGRAEGKNGD